MSREQAKGKRFGLKRVLKILGVLSALGLLCYFVVLCYSIVAHTYKTEIAITYTMTDSVYCEGVASFAWQGVAGSGELGYLVQNGERVVAGTQVAEVYTDSAQAAWRDELEQLNANISLLERSQNASASDLNMLSSQMHAALYDLLDLLDTQSYETVQAGEQQYLLSANRLQISTGQASDFSAAIAALQDQKAAVEARLGTTEGIYAGQNGYFVSAENTAFLSCDAQTLADASPAELQALLESGVESGGEGLAGKVVTSYRWQYYGLCSLEEADRFEGVTSVSISFPGVAEQQLPATVQQIDRDEASGLAKITLACEYINAEVLALGARRIKIDLHSYEGLRVSAAAMHIVDDVRGVYVKYGNTVRFRKYQELYHDDSYILIAPGGRVGTENEVRLYDEVIVEGIRIYDGKLL